MELYNILKLKIKDRLRYVVASRRENLPILDGMMYGYELGHGVFGRVYLQYLANGMKVVEKRLRVSWDDGKHVSQDVIDMAVSEVYFGMRLRDCSFIAKYICSTYDLATCTISLFFTHIEGYTCDAHFLTLSQYEIRDFTLNMWNAVIKMASILHVKYNIHHNDLHTGNIMYNPHTHDFYLLDFGVAQTSAIGVRRHNSCIVDEMTCRRSLRNNIRYLTERCITKMTARSKLSRLEYANILKRDSRFRHMTNIYLMADAFTIEDATYYA